MHAQELDWIPAGPSKSFHRLSTWATAGGLGETLAVMWLNAYYIAAHVLFCTVAGSNLVHFMVHCSYK